MSESHIERIRCPECRFLQDATVKHSEPFNVYVHCCTLCGHLITESEWEEVKSMNIQHCGFPSNLYWLLDEAGIKTVGDLIKWTKKDLFKLKRFGYEAYLEVYFFLRTNHLKLNK